jgi:TolA-binding protein
MTVQRVSSLMRCSILRFATAAAICTVIGSCKSTKQATIPDEGFFEPLRSVDQKPKVVSPRVDIAQKPSVPQIASDSLRGASKQQAAGIGDSTAHPISPEPSQPQSRIDTSQVSVGERFRRPDEPIPTGRPGILTLEGIRRQYKAQSYKATVDGCEKMLRGGVPKNEEDEYLLMLGTSYYHLKRFHQAAASLKKVVNLKGTKLKPDAYYVLGQIYTQLGLSKQARSMFEAVVRESPWSDLAVKAMQQIVSITQEK